MVLRGSKGGTRGFAPSNHNDATLCQGSTDQGRTLAVDHTGTASLTLVPRLIRRRSLQRPSPELCEGECENSSPSDSDTGAGGLRDRGSCLCQTPQYSFNSIEKNSSLGGTWAVCDGPSRLCVRSLTKVLRLQNELRWFRPTPSDLGS